MKRLLFIFVMLLLVAPLLAGLFQQEVPLQGLFLLQPLLLVFQVASACWPAPWGSAGQTL